MTPLARRTAAVTAAAALISSGGALLAAPADAAGTISSSTPVQADNRSSSVPVTVYSGSAGTFQSGDKIVLVPDDVQPWTTAGQYTAHEVKSISSAQLGVVSPTATSITANVNLVMAPPGEYTVEVQHVDNSFTTGTNNHLVIVDYGPANVRSVGFGADSSGVTSCDGFVNDCSRGAGSLDISGSNFARGADVQMLVPSTGVQDPHLHFTPGNPGNTGSTGYPSTTLIQGNYGYDADVNGAPSFVPGRHVLRVVNTYPSTSLPKNNGTVVDFYQPWFGGNAATTSSGNGTSNLLGAGATDVVVTLKGRGFNPSSRLSIQKASYSPLTPCSDITVKDTHVAAIPTDGQGNDSVVTAHVDVASCTTTGLRGMTLTGSDNGSFSRGGLLEVVAPPKVDASSFATLGQGANHYPGLTTYTFNVTGTGFDFDTAHPGPSTCPQFDFGPDTVTTTVTCGSSQSAEVKVDVDGSAVPGDRPVTVTNPSTGASSTTQPSSNPPAYAPLKIAAGPSITTVTPTSFTPSTTTPVTVVGRGFTSGMTVQLLTSDLTSGYPGVSVSNRVVTLHSATPGASQDDTLTFNLVADSTAQPGTPALVLQNADHGTKVCTCVGIDSLSVSSPGSHTVANTQPQIVTVFSNISMGGFSVGQLTASSRITLTRSDPVADQPAVVGTTVTAPDAQHVQATFDVTDAAPGAYNITVVRDTTDAASPTWSCTGCLTVSASAPTSVVIAPNKGGQGATGIPVTVTGNNLSRGTSLSIDSVGVRDQVFHPASGATASYLTAVVDIPSSTATGGHDVVVTPADGNGAVTLTNGFTVNAPPAPTSVSPTALGQGAGSDGTLKLNVIGTGFDSGATFDLGDPAISLSSFAVGADPANSATCQLTSSCKQQLSATVVVGPNAATGAHDVVVTNGDKGAATMTGAFTVNPGPRILSVTDEKGSPALRPDGAAHTLTIQGSGFSTGTAPHVVIKHGTTTVFDGSATVGTASQITVSAKLADGDTYRGPLFVSVKNPDAGYGSCDAPSPCLYAGTEPDSAAPVSVASAAGGITVRWTTAPSNGVPVTSYRVTYARTGTSTTPVVVDVPAPATSKTITGLVSGATYTVSVRAVNAVGAGPGTIASGTAFLPSTLSLAMSTSRVTYGSKITLSGRLLGTGNAPLAGKTIYFVLHTYKGNSYPHVTTDANGSYRFTYAPAYTTSVYTYWLGDSSYRLVKSTTRGFYVAARVLKTSPTSGSKSSYTTTLKIAGNVAPNKAGKVVYLYRYVNGRAYLLSKATLSSYSTYVFALKPGRGTYSLRVYIPATTGNAAGYSSYFTLYRV